MADIFDTDGGGIDQITAIKIFLGVCLVVAGLLVYSWVFLSVYRIFNDPQKIAVFTEIFPGDAESATLDIDGDEIIIPQGLMNFMAYLVAIFLLLIALNMGGQVISRGMLLIQTQKTVTTKKQLSSHERRNNA
ncbi:hypothetical protein JW890_02830 [candidate division WOR-3 bacterium]|nr:hypothetical protein [candidate division WOR-3 bacterium]